MSNIRTVLYSFKGPTEYFELLVRNKSIGIVEKVEAGWLVVGHRKPVATVEEAAKQLIDRKMSQHKNEIDKLRAMLAEALAK